MTSEIVGCTTCGGEILASSSDEPPLTDAQREELDRRLDDLEREGPVGLSWEEMLARVRRRSVRRP